MYTITYDSSRREVWGWYWRTWANSWRWWLVHIALALIIAIGISLVQDTPISVTRIALTTVAILVGFIVVFPILHQLFFRPSRCSVAVDASGLRMQMGKLSGTWIWSAVASIVENQQQIVLIERTGKVLILPFRAFQSESARQEFFRDATTWRLEAGSGAISVRR